MNERMALLKALGMLGLGVVAMVVVVFLYMVYDYLDARFSKQDNTNWDLY